MQLTRHLLIGLLGLALLAGCAQQNNAVVGKGLVQKRKYQPGWHVDLFQRSRPLAVLHTERRRSAPAVELPEQLADLTNSTMVSLEQEQDIYVFGPSASLDAMHHGAALRPSATFLSAARSTPATTPAQENLIPRKRLQPLAIPSMLFVGAGITMAFVTNSGLLVAGALVIGLVLAAVSLRRIRSHERSGKGFAIIALVLGTMAALITTMVIIRSGF